MAECNFTELRNKISSGTYNYPKKLEEAVHKEGDCKNKGEILLWIAVIIIAFSLGYMFINDSPPRTVWPQLLLIAGVLLALLSFGLLTDEESIDKAWDNYEKGCGALRVNADILARMSKEDQATLINRRMHVFGSRLLQAELKHPAEPEHEERLDAREAFEYTYQTLLTAGLIEDVGYGKFIPKKEELPS